MKKTAILAGVAVILTALSFPLSNLLHRTNPENQQMLARIQDPAFQKAAPILQTKCLDCHSSQARIPFYADFPIARDLIRADMAAGIASFTLDGKLSGDGQGFTELDLARLEGVLSQHSMPPFRYVALHWDANLNGQENADLMAWIYQLRAKRNPVEGAHADFAGEPVQPLPLTIQLNPNQVALGRQLFHDTRLSGDNTISCASCHALDKGGTDRARTSTGIRGQIGPINAPTVYNAGFNIKQFWDGRAETLEEQAGGPVTNPLEMDATWDAVLAKLRQDPQVVQAFRQAYPDGLTSDNVMRAIATFERSLVTPNSKFDRYLRGEKNTLSQVELRGYQIFKTNCISCHAGKNLGGLSFQKMGVKGDYFAARGGPVQESDYGLFNFTKQEADKHKFKVPTLRNIAQTAPYFHDGSADTLDEAVRVMAQYQVGKTLTEQEISAVVAFLQTLTGEYEGRPVQ